MEVTSITIQNISPKEKGVCAECSIVLDDSLCIHRILIVSGDKGMFIAFPNTGELKCYKNAKRYVDIVHPTHHSMRLYIQNEVLNKYYEELKNIKETSYD